MTHLLMRSRFAGTALLFQPEGRAVQGPATDQEHQPLVFIHKESAQVGQGIGVIIRCNVLAEELALFAQPHDPLTASIGHIQVADHRGRAGVGPGEEGHRPFPAIRRWLGYVGNRLPHLILGDAAIAVQKVHVAIDGHIHHALQVLAALGHEILLRRAGVSV